MFKFLSVRQEPDCNPSILTGVLDDIRQSMEEVENNNQVSRSREKARRNVRAKNVAEAQQKLEVGYGKISDAVKRSSDKSTLSFAKAARKLLMEETVFLFGEDAVWQARRNLDIADPRYGGYFS